MFQGDQAIKISFLRINIIKLMSIPTEILLSKSHIHIQLFIERKII